MKNSKFLLFLLSLSLFMFSCRDKGKAEFACIIDKCSGTECLSGYNGNSNCSLHSCEPVPSGCIQALTVPDIESAASQHAANLLKKGFIDEFGVEDVKDVVRNILKTNNSKTVQ